jgi:hypothetical protein
MSAWYPSSPMAYPIGMTSNPYPNEADMAKLAVVDVVS